MQCKPFKTIAAIPAAVTNILNPPTLTGGVGVAETKTYLILTHIRILNKDSTARTFAAYIGATGGSAAGTEFIGKDVSVPANSYVDWYGRVYMKTSDFLTMVASTVTTLVANIEGEIGICD